MASCTLWVPGRFKLTNQMLSDLRAAGFYAGRARHGAAAKRCRDFFAAETQAIRLAVKAAAIREGIGIEPPPFRASIGLTVFGHQKHDPDAWYLFAKAAIDGLVDAKVLTSDRRNLGTVSGYVVQSGEAVGRPKAADDGPGVCIHLDCGYW